MRGDPHGFQGRGQPLPAPERGEAALHPHAGLPDALRADGVPQTHRGAPVPREADRVPGPDAPAGRGHRGADAGNKLAEERPGPHQPIHRRPGAVRDGGHWVSRHVPRPLWGGGEVADKHKRIHPQEGRPGPPPHPPQVSRHGGALPREDHVAAVRPQPRRPRWNPRHAHRGVRDTAGGGALVPGVCAAATQDAQEPRPLWVCSGARRVGDHRPFRPGEDSAGAADSGRGEQGDLRSHRGPSGPGRDKHRIGQERRQRNPLRMRADDRGHRGRLRPARPRGEHPGAIPAQQRQQHPLRWPQHPRTGRRGGPESDPAPPRHRGGLPQGSGHLNPAAGTRLGLPPRQWHQRQASRQRAARLPRRRGCGVQGGPHLQDLLPRREAVTFKEVPDRHDRQGPRRRGRLRPGSGDSVAARADRR
mmetsp:Transcript_6785/g.16427  ORF Transcript_6785/g.16427 Transcript_6785/m.16427 type:complete len:418 (+) Transcript_6785:131-1384(+)